MQKYRTQGGVQTPNIIYLRIQTLKKEVEIGHFYLTKCKIFLGKVACILQNSYIA